MTNSGKLVIAAILGIGILAAAAATWHNYRGSQRALEFWGRPAARRIAQAPQVEALELGPPADGSTGDGSTGDGSTGDTEQRSVRRKKLVSQARGMLNIRHALVQDTTFDWSPGRPPGEIRFGYALRFEQDGQQSTLLFDFDRQQVALAGHEGTARLDPAASADVRQFFAEQFAENSAAGPESPGGPGRPSAEAP